MFAARCDYVAKLLPPSNFSSRLEQAIGIVLTLRIKRQILTNLLKPDRRDYFGDGRFSDEHWITSHPDLKPCDCDPKGSLKYYQARWASLNELEWSMAPRSRGTPFSSLQNETLQIEKDVSLRLREYFLLPGNLVKWFTLYGKVPPTESWAWTWFPDGEFWKEAISQHGIDAVDAVTRSYGEFKNHDAPYFSAKKHNSFKSLTSQPGLIYSITMSKNVSDSDFQSHLFMVKKELNVLRLSLQSTRAKFSIYVLTLGHPLLRSIDICSYLVQSFNCENVGHFEDIHIGESLRVVSNFCASNPSQTVVHLPKIQPKIQPLSANLIDKTGETIFENQISAATSSLCYKS